MTLRVDPERLRADFDALAGIGATPDGGLERTTFSEAHLAARAWFRRRAEESGFVTRVDAAANHSATLAARDPGARTLLLGSHLDSVRRGGRYDGALGVVCALEVLRVVRDAGLELPVSLEAIDFTDEEGTLIGTLGSLALAGRLSREDLGFPRGGRDRLSPSSRGWASRRTTCSGRGAIRRRSRAISSSTSSRARSSPGRGSTSAS